MMVFRLSFLTITFILLLFTNVHASRYQSVRQKRADVCTDLTANACLFVICENNGQCLQDQTTTDCYRCQCQPGFTGKLCETSVPILPAGCNPQCQNGAFCNVDVCQCLPGYTGTLCETRDYCLPTNPCQNGGRCVSNAAEYQCDCTGTGYTGENCTQITVTDPCAINPCQNGGQCSSNGGQVFCQCFNGYTGLNCQFSPVPCATTPCLNGGTCNLLSTSGSGCTCSEDFTGAQCENDVLATHPCVTMPERVCLNGGECLVNDADYLCKCAQGWSGRNCQTQETINTCNPNPCSHGTCTDVSVLGSIVQYCTCESRWTGRWCDVNMDNVCYAGYCSSGGVCRVNGNVPYCECSPLYTGERCESLVSAVTTTTTTTTVGPAVSGCAPNPCLNGGNCFNNGNSFVCVCPSTSTGQTCETLLVMTTTTTLPPVVSGCAPNPCLNGGNCFNNGNSFVCACSTTWTGRVCETSLVVTPDTTLSPGISACASNPCFNGGTCYGNANAFQCVCLPSYTGNRCQNSQTITVTPPLTTPSVFNMCASQPCRNGGVCYNANNSFFCQCSNPYTGTYCESVIAAICPLNCAPGICTLSGNPSRPYVCNCNGVLKLTSCTSK